MQTFAHVYITLLPVAAGLLLTSALLSTDGGTPVLRKRVPAIAAIWLGSSLVVLAMFFKPNSSFSTGTFVAQRDIGYMLGGALGISVPFLVCTALAFVSHKVAFSRAIRFFGLALTGTWLFFAVPQFFAVGTVAGCALLGYSSCM